MKIISRFEKAVREHEMMGSKYPDEWPEIKKEYKEAKKALIATIKILTEAVKRK